MWFVNIVLWFLFFAVFIPFGIYLYHVGYNDAREEGKCKGCVCYSFTVNALRDYYDEPFKDHDQHPFDYTEFDKYMDFVDEQVGKLKKEIEDDDL